MLDDIGIQFWVSTLASCAVITDTSQTKSTNCVLDKSARLWLIGGETLLVMAEQSRISRILRHNDATQAIYWYDIDNSVISNCEIMG